MTITIREVAMLAGVSQATAARALNGYGSVSESTIEKVTQAAAQLGYRTNPVAQALRRGHSTLIGFVAGDLENPYFATVARNLSDAVEEAGYTIVVSSSDERLDRERKIVETLQTQLVSAVAITPVSGYDRSHLAKLDASGIPIVIIDRPIPDLQADAVTVDNVGGTRAGVEHLLNLGHTRIAFLTDDLPIAPSRERLEGYRQALIARGIAPDPALIVFGQSSRQGGFEAALRLLSLEPRPTAVFAGDNLMTLGMLRASHTLDLAIPDDVALVGFDDFDVMTAVHPTVSAVAQPVAEVGRRAGELLVRRLQGHDGPPEHVSLPTELIVRESSGPLLPRSSG